MGERMRCVGARLPAIAIFHSAALHLNECFRGQARSYNGAVPKPVQSN
jgi:hypothetical protein